ncbi:MAG: DUF4912 domain-containing protein [Thermodesulfovibrionales bacterium]|nr:DUF4912 domain-containing protein [Thermodesulfovibrionales bacterium]
MKIRVKSKSKKTEKPSKKTEKIKDKKPAKKTDKKAVTKGKAKAKKPIKSKKETKEQGKKAVKKPTAIKAEKAKKTTTRKKATEKAIKKEPKKIALPAKKIARIPQRTLKKIESVAVTAEKALPAEYGEDRITLMTVDPWKLFAYWEIKENTLSKIKGMLVLRVYDITGVYFDGKNANVVFDVPVHGRIGDSYIGVGPDKVFIVDIGAVSKAGDFVAIARSNQASTPALKVAKEEGALPQEIYEVGPVTGYV